MTVVFYHRKPQHWHFSLEEYFATVRAHLPEDVRWRIAESSHASRGLWRRAANILEASRRQGDINHVTGDIHYITFGLAKRKTVLTILDCAFEQRLSGLRRELFRTVWFKWPERRVTRLTAISQFTKDRLVALLDCPPEKIDVIPVCVPSGVAPQPKPFASGRPVVLQVGTTPTKNVERLAQALRGLTCDLRIIGKLDEAQRALLAGNEITYTNAEELSREAIVREYERADVVAFVSTYEGFGIPILEGQAVGRPVLTSTVASMPEVAGDAALLVDPYDVEAIRDGLRRLLTDAGLRARLVERGFRNIQRFTPQVVADAYARLYRSLAAGVPR